MVAKAMIVQSFPSLPSFTGENKEKSFERRFKSFEDSARVVGWLVTRRELVPVKVLFCKLRLPCRHLDCFPGEDKLLCLC